MAVCNHCSAKVRRGAENVAKNKCYNSGMQSHMATHHKAELEEVRMEQAAIATGGRERDDKDETVRGNVPIFNLRSKADRRAWRERVSIWPT